MSLSQKPGYDRSANPLTDLPELPELPSLKPEEVSALKEWWRLVRETLKRNNDIITQ